MNCNFLMVLDTGHSSLIVKAYKAEYAKLIADHKKLNERYLSMKDKLKEAEQIRKSVYSILRQEQLEQQLHKAQDMNR